MENYIYGKNAVLEAITKNPKRINKIYISKNIGLDNRLKKIKELALNNSILLQFINLNKFDEVIKGTENEPVNFQGVVASIAPIEYYDFEKFVKNTHAPNKPSCHDVSNETSLDKTCLNKYRKIIMLDSVEDPHNFGAIIRTAAAAGYDAIVIPNRRSCPVNATVEKTSAGAANHIPIIKVNSLSGAVDYLKNNDWWIIALDGNCIDNYSDINYKDMNFVLVLGNEGEGISKTLLNKADFKVKIPTKFESLNVSVACAVVVYESIRQIEAAAK